VLKPLVLLGGGDIDPVAMVVDRKEVAMNTRFLTPLCLSF
jgi:hypothetical protein